MLIQNSSADTVSADEKTTLADIEIPTNQLEPTTDDNSTFQVPESNHYNVPPTLPQYTRTPSELDISQQIPEANMPSQQESQPAENNLVTESNITTKLPENDAERLKSKPGRSGTYDKNLNRIGD